MNKLLLAFAALLAVTIATPGVLVPVQQQHVEDEGPPQPYSFSYTAGRAPGHVDRVHSETRDPSGIVRGEFKYVDPRNRVRTVQYVADALGFHPIVDGGVTATATDTPIVAAAKIKHLKLKERIAAEHARIGAEHARLNAERAAAAGLSTEQTLRHNEETLAPIPYSFSYEAGRYPGHVDRTHTEQKDAAGAVSGEYSYVDPRFKVQTVQYTADKNGFQAVVNNPVTDTPAVAAAKRRHLLVKQQILDEHARLATANNDRRTGEFQQIPIATNNQYNVYQTPGQVPQKNAYVVPQTNNNVFQNSPTQTFTSQFGVRSTLTQPELLTSNLLTKEAVQFNPNTNFGRLSTQNLAPTNFNQQTNLNQFTVQQIPTSQFGSKNTLPQPGLSGSNSLTKQAVQFNPKPNFGQLYTYTQEFSPTKINQQLNQYKVYQNPILEFGAKTTVTQPELLTKQAVQFNPRPNARTLDIQVDSTNQQSTDNKYQVYQTPGNIPQRSAYLTPQVNVFQAQQPSQPQYLPYSRYV